MPSRTLRNLVLGLCGVGIVLVAVDQMAIRHGESEFARLGCANCHANGGGPNLARVNQKYDASTLVRFIADPEQVYRERGQKPLNPGYVGMHRVKASAWEIRTIAYYLRNVTD